MQISSTEEAVLHTLSYFDVFGYPLTSDEIKLFFRGQENPNGNVDKAINILVSQKKVFRQQQFFLLNNNVKQVNKRLEGNKRAERYLQIAKKMSVLIGNFPFVRGVFVSGSLSKGYIGEDADIDYFIVTKPQRLWLARTALVLFKKLFLLNSRKYFCVNYFLDEDHLEIEEKNLFTATELVTLLPMYNPNVFKNLKQENQWVTQFYPFHDWSNYNLTHIGKGSYLKQFLEFVLSGSLGSTLDKLSMKFTLFFWRKKFKHFTPKEFGHALKSRQYVSKHHPQNFQKKVMDAYNQKINEYIGK